MAKKFTQEDFERIVKEKYNGEFVVVSEYTGSKEDVSLKCNHGHVFTVKGQKVTKTDGLKGCPKCLFKTEEDYEKEPKFCKQCGEKIKFTTSYSTTMKKDFCNSSCAATFNNLNSHGEDRKCLYCGQQLGKSASKYCSHQCQMDFQYEQYIRNWKSGIENGTKGNHQISNHIRRYLFEKYDCKCAECGWNKKNPYSGKYALEIEHIDGNYENNKEENLILLCPNCHSLTPTYKALNYGNGRKNRQK